MTLKATKSYLLFRHWASPPYLTVKHELPLTSVSTQWTQLCFMLTKSFPMVKSGSWLHVWAFPVSSSLVNCIQILSDTRLLGNSVLLRSSAFFSFSHLHFFFFFSWKDFDMSWGIKQTLSKDLLKNQAFLEQKDLVDRRLHFCFNPFSRFVHGEGPVPRSNAS